MLFSVHSLTSGPLSLEGEGFAPWICEGRERALPWSQSSHAVEWPEQTLGAKGEGVTGGDRVPLTLFAEMTYSRAGTEC